jgi:hypothetical protein
MRFSEAFKVQRGQHDDWFDPDLSIDTPLFIDPLLLLMSNQRWHDAHSELIAHFTQCYELVAKSNSFESNSAKVAARMLTFPEPSEFCLGYTAAGTRGAGSGRGFAKKLLESINVAIKAGLTNPSHIEELGILNERFGADRISDATCNVLKAHFIAYTQEVCKRHNIPMECREVKNARFNKERKNWISEEVELPINKKSDFPIILVPEKFLNNLPILNAGSWFNSNLNDDLRTDLNLKIGQQVNKARIVTLARQNASRVREWVDQVASENNLAGYNFTRDPMGVIQFDRQPVIFASKNPLDREKVATQEDLSLIVEDILHKFKIFIEEQRGWELLWNSDETEKPESAVQLAFLGMARHYLAQYDVELDREVELGRGPVDFKVSSGSKRKLLIEVKKLNNGRFWNGLERQLPSYLASDGSIEGWFIAVRYRDKRSAESKLKDLSVRVNKLNTDTQKIRFVSIDARPKKSASKL